MEITKLKENIFSSIPSEDHNYCKPAMLLKSETKVEKVYRSNNLKSQLKVKLCNLIWYLEYLMVLLTV